MMIPQFGTIRAIIQNPAPDPAIFQQYPEQNTDVSEKTVYFLILS